MSEFRRNARVLIYSHDTFGLGHLRRCRAIAHALVERNKETSVLILTGSPIIGSFDFRARVDFVRIPGVIKLRNGDYTSLSLLIDIEETLAPEWGRKNVLPALRDLYDDIWVYGLPQICDPLAGIELPRSVRQKMTYTG